MYFRTALVIYLAEMMIDCWHV